MFRVEKICWRLFSDTDLVRLVSIHGSRTVCVGSNYSACVRFNEGTGPPVHQRG